MARITLEKLDKNGKYLRDQTFSEGTARNLLKTWPKEYRIKQYPDGQTAEIEISAPPPVKKKDAEVADIREEVSTPGIKGTFPRDDSDQLNPEIVKAAAKNVEESVSKHLVEEVVKKAKAVKKTRKTKAKK